jgi:general secretion pathway protein F
MLGTLLDNKVPIVRAMELAESGVQLKAVAHKLQLAVRDLRGGKKLADALALHKTVNPMGINLVRVGERTGELPGMLRTLGHLYENASRERMKRFLILLEPATILIVGCVIGFIMVAIMLAITSLSTMTL